MKNERYYYSIMNNDEKSAYRCIYEGLINRSFEIYVTTIYDYGTVQIIYLKVLFDHPLFYYVNQKIIKMIGEPLNYCLMPEYLYTAKEINDLNILIKNKVDYICSKARSFDNQFRIEKYLHDSIIKSVAYDYDSLMKKDCFDAHSIIGVFIHKKAVCEGIAKAFKLLCNEMNIKCIVVIGKANQEGDFSGDSFHAWNIVKIEDESYYVDVTWDNSYEDDFMHISYDYFNMTTKEIEKDHAPEEKLPICVSNKHNYFHCTNSFVNTYSELKLFIKQRLKNDSIIFRVSQPSKELGNIEALKSAVFSALQEIADEGREVIYPLRIFFNDLLLIGKIYVEKRKA